MRVTQNMLMSQGARNLETSSARLLRLQGMMSSLRRISQPSDDPSGTATDLSLRKRLLEFEQYGKNISRGRTWTSATESNLNEMTSLLSQAKEIAVALANDTYDAAARAGAATQAQSIFDQTLQLANSQLNGRYLFSGHMTRTAAFAASSTGVVYQGDQGLIRAQIDEISTIGINIIGSDLLMPPVPSLGGTFDLDAGVNGATLLADLQSGTGVDLAPGTFVVTDENTGASVAVDVSAATDVSDVLAAINTQIAATIPNLTATLSPSGDGLRLEASGTSLISGQTKLANLNLGRGVQLGPGTFRVVNDSGTGDVTIDLSGSVTVNDAITAFNTQMTAAAATQDPGLANVTLAINGPQDGLVITDGNGAPLGLRVEEIGGATTAGDLGFGGYVDPSLDSGDLKTITEFGVAEAGAGQTTAVDLGLLGTFQGVRDGDDLNPILQLTTPLTLLNSGRGVAQDRIRISLGATYAVVDFSSATTVGDVITAIANTGLQVSAGINSAGTGIQVTSTVNTMSLRITGEGSDDTAKQLGLYGSPDVFGNVQLLIDALNANDGDSVSGVIDGLQDALEQVLSVRAGSGARVQRLDATEQRLADLTLSATRLLSEVEDADVITVTTDLATQQNVYQAALNAMARILQPSLSDFLR